HRRLLTWKRVRADLEREHLKSAAYEGGEGNQCDRQWDGRRPCGGAECQGGNGEQEEHPDGSWIVRGKLCRRPTPEEIADAPRERRDPDELIDVRLRLAEPLVQVKCDDRQNGTRGDRGQCIAEDERPDATLEQVGPGHFRGSMGNLRKKWRTGDCRPNGQPDESEAAGGQKGRPPAVADRKRAEKQRHHHRPNSAAAERQRDPARTHSGGQRFDGRPQSSGKRRTFTESE